MKTEKWISKNTTSLTGKTVAISGSTGGLGSALCHHLASLGATLILIDRNIEKSQRLASEIKNKYDVTVDFVKDGVRYLNPGSVSIPKNGSAHSVMVYENGEFRRFDIETGAEYTL